MKIQISMTRKEVVRTEKMIEVIMGIIEKIFGKTLMDVHPSADSLMDSANNTVSYGVGSRAEVLYTADEMAVSIDIKEKMYDASCTFCEKVAEKAVPVVNFCMAGIKMLETFCEKVAEKDTPMVNFCTNGIKMLEDFCESFKSDMNKIQNECFNELEKELEDSARYAVVSMKTLDDDLQVAVFKRYADSKVTDIMHEVHTSDAIAFEMQQLKAFGKNLNSNKFLYDCLDDAIYKAVEIYEAFEARYHHNNDQCVQEEKGE